MLQNQKKIFEQVVLYSKIWIYIKTTKLKHNSGAFYSICAEAKSKDNWSQLFIFESAMEEDGQVISVSLV